MSEAEAEPRWLPLFPLPIVVFPGDVIPLHIFEERYKALVSDCIGEEAGAFSRWFGICLFHEHELQQQGCAVLIDEVLRRYPDGRLDIQTRGMKRFSVLATRDEQPYQEAEVEFYEDDAPAGEEELAARARALCKTYIDLVDVDARPSAAGTNQVLSFQLASRALTDLMVRQRILEKTSETERLDFLVQYFERAIPRLRKMEGINHRIKTNGHFHGFPSVEDG